MLGAQAQNRKLRNPTGLLQTNRFEGSVRLCTESVKKPCANYLNHPLRLPDFQLLSPIRPNGPHFMSK